VVWVVSSHHTLRECTFVDCDNSSEDWSAYNRVQVHMPTCTKLYWSGSVVAYPLFFHPNVQIVDLLHLDPPDEVLLKSLHNYLSNCPCLQQLRIKIDECPGLDSLIQFVFCDAQEQGVWHEIRSVELNELFFFDSDARDQDQNLKKIAGQTQPYQKWWKELALSRETDLEIEQVIIKATM
jgi:hypothetical protein